MKKILIYLNILIYFCLLFTSCKEESIDESIPVVPVINPIKAVTAQDGEDVANALISKDDKTIVLIFFLMKMIYLMLNCILNSIPEQSWFPYQILL